MKIQIGNDPISKVSGFSKKEVVTPLQVYNDGASTSRVIPDFP